MVRWRYRGTTVFFVGLIFSTFTFTAVLGSSLSAAPPGGGFLGQLPGFSDSLIVRHPLSDPIGAAHAEARPLSEAQQCLSLLRARRETAEVIPLAVQNVVVRKISPDAGILGEMKAFVLDDEAWRMCRARLIPGSAGLPLTLEGGIVLEEKFLTSLARFGGTHLAARRPLFIDRPAGGRDPFNLVRVTLAGTFISAGTADASVVPVCFISTATLRHSAWRNVFDFGSTAQAAEGGGNAVRPVLIEKTDAGRPLDLPFLFSLSTVDRDRTHEPPEITPTFLLVTLTPQARSHRSAVREEISRAFAGRGLEAVITDWNEENTRVRVLPWRFFAVLAAALLVIIIAANIVLSPVLTEVLPEETTDGGFGLSFWRPSFLARNAGIAFLFGAGGALAAFGAIIAYDTVLPASLRAVIEAWCGLGPIHPVLTFSGPAVAASGAVLFAVCSLFGPRRRAARIARLLAAEPHPVPPPHPER